MEATELKKLVALRHDLHRHPEVSCKEYETQKRILAFLEGLGISHAQPVGSTGVWVKFEGKEAGKTVMLRGDTDALPIQEINNFTHQSTQPGVSHKCGHDGHTTIMAGVAAQLLKNPPAKGTAILLFQPAEENGHGARAVLDDTQFDIQPDVVFALHNLPGYPQRKIVIREGSFTAAAKSIIIKLDGKTSHAAEPELGINPAAAIADLITMFQNASQPDLSRDDFALTTPVYIHMGEKSYGVSAGHGEVHYTLRTWHNDVMEKLCEQVAEAVERIAKQHKLKATISWTEEFFANQNHPDAVHMVTEAAKANGLELETRPTPFKWGEDFGLFTEKFRGAMFGIGSGEDCPALHNPDYDFPDALIEPAVGMFTHLIQQALDE
jgi:amidohydrolase